VQVTLAGVRLLGRLDHRRRLVDGIDMLDVVGQSRGERSCTTTDVKDPFASLG
jgi:hypothetical protein